MPSKSWWRKALDPTLWNQIERAQAEITVREERFRALKAHRPGLARDPRAVEAMAVIEGLLERARTAVAGNDQQGAWYALDDIDEELVWTMTRGEAEVYGGDVAARFNKKHAGSIGEYAAALVAKESLKGLNDARVRERVRKAAELRHQHWEYKYHAAGMLVGHVALLATGLAIALAAFLFLAGLKRSAGLLPEPFDQPPFVVAVVLLGMIGGAASAILSATAGDRILPDTAKAAPWYFARPLFGAAAAVLVTVLLAGDALGVSVDKRSTYLAWATAAGFSEGLLTKLASKMESKVDEDAKS